MKQRNRLEAGLEEKRRKFLFPILARAEECDTLLRALQLRRKSSMTEIEDDLANHFHAFYGRIQGRSYYHFNHQWAFIDEHFLAYYMRMSYQHDVSDFLVQSGVLFVKDGKVQEDVIGHQRWKGTHRGGNHVTEKDENIGLSFSDYPPKKMEAQVTDGKISVSSYEYSSQDDKGRSLICAEEGSYWLIRTFSKRTEDLGKPEIPWEIKAKIEENPKGK